MRKLFALLVIALSAVAVASPAGAGGNGADRMTLYSNGDPFCDLSGFLTIGTATESSAVLQYDKSLNQVGATVTLKGVTPNQTYYVRLIQGNDDCQTDDGTVTTNGQGNGTLSIAEPAVNTKADVFVCNTPAPGCAGEHYASEPIYSHP